MKLTTPFYLYLKPQKVHKITGRLTGTVTSGHPTKTTLGNSLRVGLMAMFLQYEARIPNEEIEIFV
jgi:hypothetical protein